MAAYFAGSFFSAFSTTSMTGLNRIRGEPMASRTVVSQPYLPRRPSMNGWNTPGSTGRDDGFWMMDDGSGTGPAVWAWSVRIRDVKARIAKAPNRLTVEPRARLESSVWGDD